MKRINYLFIALGFLALIGCFGNLAVQATPFGLNQYVYNNISYVGGFSWLMPILATLAIAVGFLRVFKREQLSDLSWWTILIASLGIVLSYIVQAHAMSSLNDYAGASGSTPGWGIYFQLFAYTAYLIFGVILYLPENETVARLLEPSPYSRKDIIFILGAAFLYLLILEGHILNMVVAETPLSINFDEFEYSIWIQILPFFILLKLILAPIFPKVTHIFYQAAASSLATLAALVIIFPLLELQKFFTAYKMAFPGGDVSIEYGLAYFVTPALAALLAAAIWLKWKQQQKLHTITELAP